MVDIAQGLFHGGMASNANERIKNEIGRRQVALGERELNLKADLAARKTISDAVAVTRDEIDGLIQAAREAKAKGAPPEKLQPIRRLIETMGAQLGVPAPGLPAPNGAVRVPGSEAVVQSGLNRFDAIVGATIPEATEPEPVFEGTGMEQQAANLAIGLADLVRRGIPLSAAQRSAYAVAYNELTAPRVVGSPTTGFSVVQPTLDQSLFPPPHALGVSSSTGLDATEQAAPVSVKPIMGPQQRSAAEAGRASMVVQGARAAKQIKDAIVNPDGTTNAETILTMSMGIPFSEGRKVRAQLEDAIAAKLRLETGANAPQAEVENMADRFAPSIFDSDKTVSDKLDRMMKFFEGTLSRMEPDMFKRLSAQARAEGNIPEPPANETGAEFTGFDPSTGFAVFRRPDGTHFSVRANAN